MVTRHEERTISLTLWDLRKDVAPCKILGALDTRKSGSVFLLRSGEAGVIAREESESYG